MLTATKENQLSSEIERLSLTQKIDVVGFCDASEFEGYLLPSSKRKNPKLTIEDANTIIVFGVYIGAFYLPFWNNPNVGRTSRLFLSGYFNDIVDELIPIAEYLKKEGYKAEICNDLISEKSIIPLKLAAVRAGLGWQGKNSLLVTKRYGTFLALGGILTNAFIKRGNPLDDNYCKNCTRCQKACPAGAISNAHILNKEKCLSYLLQTDKDLSVIRDLAGNRIMDCEICQEVCPWNSKHIKDPITSEKSVLFKDSIQECKDLFKLKTLVNLDESEYVSRFKRFNTDIPYEFFHRNVVNAIENAKR